jgi:tungstate transport system substrate-binding protein
MLAPVAAACGDSASGQRELLLASTTSTEDSGLLDVLVPAFEERMGYDVKLISGGSGQALENARRGDVDVLLSHSPAAEEELVRTGDVIERAPVMHNRFVIVGPSDDPAGVAGSATAADAFAAIARSGRAFVSRGDESGTHVVELAVWAAAGIDPSGADWYSETGQGQAATLQVAGQQRAYALTDIATFLVLSDSIGLRLIFDREDMRLVNRYHVMVVNPERHPDVNVAGARAWAAFVTGPEGQQVIREFGAGRYREPLFVPDAALPRP